MARVLIADDNPILTEAFAQLLAALGYDVAVAHDDLAALCETTRLLPDAVFVDVGLPVLGGFELARRLRQRHGDAFRLVAYTAWADITHDEAASAGFDSVLIKPATLAEILSAIGDDARSRAGARPSVPRTAPHHTDALGDD